MELNLNFLDVFKSILRSLNAFEESLNDTFTFLHGKENQFFGDEICARIYKNIFSHFQTFARTSNSTP